jgi:prepilin peptidase CpaA
MQGGYLSQVLVVALACALVYACWTDLRRREIDNWLNAAIAIGAPLFWLSAGIGWVDIVFQIGIAIVVFIVLVLLFVSGAMGGGDVKLLTALALWIQPILFVKLLIVMSVAGGLLTLVFGGLHLLRKREGRVAVPYGVAIGFAGLWALATIAVPGMQDAAILG